MGFGERLVCGASPLRRTAAGGRDFSTGSRKSGFADWVVQTMVTQKDIERGLQELGLRSGDTVVVHSSLSSFGKVAGGAETLVDALLAVLGADGTLVVPTFTYALGVFDPRETPSAAGNVTEAVRNRPNAIRSLHPSHSVTAIGRLAKAVTERHEKAHPFGRGSALFKVLQANGKILQLGTNQTTNSMVHVAEEIVEMPYLDRSREAGIRTIRGEVVHRWIRRPGCSQGFGAIEEDLQQQGAIVETFIGKCRARLMSARAVVKAAVEALKLNPEALLCDAPDCETCAQARAMIAATEVEKQDKEVIELAKEEERTLRLVQRQFDEGEVRYFETDENDRSPN